jgi:GNAT superfamily N-acetyltransferase
MSRWMVSQTLPREREKEPDPSGLRPMDPARDLGSIAHVIEVAFAEELSPGGHLVMRDLRLLNMLRPFLWVVSRAIPAIQDFFGGYVWEADGRVVGNLTVTRADGLGGQWIISNVAVLPEYRRRGIARHLMAAAMRYVAERGGARVMLQVRSDNLAARALYEDLGFRYLESVTEMISYRVQLTPLTVPPGVFVIKPIASRWYEAFDVARAAIPQAVQEIRPLRAQNFHIRAQSGLERLADGIFGPRQERWWAEVEGRVGGLLTIQRQAGPQPEQIEMLIHPGAAGKVEAALVNQVAARLRGREQVRATITADLTLVRELLREAGFRELRTLDQMALDL